MPEQALNPVIHLAIDSVCKFHTESRIAAGQKPGRIINDHRLRLLPVRIDDILKNGHGSFCALTRGCDDLLVPAFDVSG